MPFLYRVIGAGFLACCLLALVLKLLVPLPAPLGYAPVDLGLGPRITPVEVVIWYGTEKQAWLEEAARRFQARGETVGIRPITLRLVGMGSRDIAERAARQDWSVAPRPTVVSPASSLWTDTLADEWAARNRGKIIAGEATPLVLTPLVVVSWEQRARLLWPDGAADFWNDLHDAIANEKGWSAVAAARGLRPDTEEAQQAGSWGPVKLGHTSPLTSNSGTQTLVLMAYAFYNKTAGLTVADIEDPAFLSWLEAIEVGVYDLGSSTGTLMQQMVQRGPSSYDFVIVYENLAIKYMDAGEQRWSQPLRVYYPPATIFSDHPYAILDDPLTSREEREAARRFRQFLLQRPQQELALQYGFRPFNPDVVLSDAANPFVRYADRGVSLDIAAQVESPPAEVLTALLKAWDQSIGPLAPAARP
ncbi:MAG: substrate-binding domain-containing protein [Chloroflexaceae bacterium]